MAAMMAARMVARLTTGGLILAFAQLRGCC
jgi:hypothetical protein